MTLLAIVREVLHDGQHGSTLLAKDESLAAIEAAVINRSGCLMVELVSPITDKKAIHAFEILTGLNISKLHRIILDIGILLAPPESD